MAIVPRKEYETAGPRDERGGRLPALRDVTLEVDDGETLCLVGPSGCGKSTLLKIVAGLEFPTRGRVFYDQVDMTEIKAQDRGVGMIFQDYALYPSMKSKGNLAYYFEHHEHLRPEMEARVRQTAELMGVDFQHLLGRFPETLSGGEQQRVAIARCIVRDPTIFLMDEPIVNLDAKRREQTRIEFKKLLRTFRITTLYVTHDQQEAVFMGDRPAVMRAGRIEQMGTFDELYYTPANLFVATFIGTPPINILPTVIAGRQLHMEAGSEWDLLRLRLARLRGGIGVLKIGAVNEHALEIRKEQLARALRVLEAAYDGGLVPGGGVALLNCLPALECLRSRSQADEAQGVALAAAALQAPFVQIVRNHGALYPPLVLDEVRRLGRDYGLDALRGDYASMWERGILDCRTVLQGALQAATSFLFAKEMVSMLHMNGQDAPRRAWRRLPLAALREPLLALAVGRGRLWAGGLGGVACRRLEGAPDEWEAGPVLPQAPVVTLCSCGDVLLAGGSGGIAYLQAGRSDWQPAALEGGADQVMTLAPSPDFARDQTLLAGTLLNGVLRSNDGGRSWQNGSFGMECLEVTTLLWLSPSLVLAATDDGIYRSRDGGRGWRQVLEGSDDVVTSLTRLADGSLLAVLEGGRVLRASERGEDWSAVTRLSSGLCVLCLTTTARGTLLLAMGNEGLLRSCAGRRSWQAVHNGSVHVCIKYGGRLYAGTDEGLLMSEDDGVSWQTLPRPPLQDLHRLFVQNDHLFLAGTYSGMMRLALTDAGEARGAWESLAWLPQPLMGWALLDDETLLAAGIEGLLRLSLDDERRTRLIARLPEQPMAITSAIRGGQRHLWVASGDGQQLWHSDDDGSSWRSSRPPFGVSTLVALQAAGGDL
jgi:ABC-type sugar transport system ATPase subunit/photosystem II stability/assembly factor-like uncharacterized protein